MPLKNEALTITYLAWNTSTSIGQTGDAANHTLRAVGDGTEFTPTNAPVEVDSTILKGIYKISLLASELNYNFFTLGGISSTANVVIRDVSFPTDRGVLPNVPPTTQGAPITVGTGTGQLNTTNGGITGNITGNLSGSVGSVTGAVGSVTGAVGSVTGTVGGNVVGTVASVTGAVGSVTGSVGSVTGAVGSVAGNVAGNVVGTVGSVLGDVDGNLLGHVAGGVVGTVGGVAGNVTGSVGSVTAGVALSAAGLDAVAIESLNARQALDVILAVAAGVLSGASSGGGTIVIKDPSGTNTRVQATTDSNGNRTSVTITPPA